MLLSDQHEPATQADDDLENHRLVLVYEGVELIEGSLETSDEPEESE